MYKITTVTDDPNQFQNLVLYNGNILELTMRYAPMQYGWFLTSLVYGTWELDNLRITVGYNLLRQFKNEIPFGLACLPNNINREPTQQEDFESGAFNLYILNEDEVLAYEALLAGI